MTQLVGILNLTPDSFSDGGLYPNTASAIDAALALAGQGASIIDVGAESTRPGATPLSHAEEWARLESTLPELCRALAGKAEISLDTRHAETAHKALQLGVQWINDVSGLIQTDMLQVLAQSDCRIVAMHSLSIPADSKLTLPENTDVIEAMAQFVKQLLALTNTHGITRERLVFDPGLGFGKTAQQSLELIQRIGELKALGLPLYIGHSRKSFLRLLTADYASDRDRATLEISRQLAKAGVDYLRVHDVAAHRGIV